MDHFLTIGNFKIIVFQKAVCKPIVWFNMQNKFIPLSLRNMVLELINIYGNTSKIYIKEKNER